MKPPLLAPQNLWLSLPALSAHEAEMILHLVDELQRLLWEAYGDAVIDNRPEPDSPWQCHDGEDDPDF